MTITKYAVSVKVETSPTVEDQILETIKSSKSKTVRLETDSKGNVIINKESHHELYDWAVNG